MGCEVTGFLEYLVLTLKDKIYQCISFGLRPSLCSGISPVGSQGWTVSHSSGAHCLLAQGLTRDCCLLVDFPVRFWAVGFHVHRTDGWTRRQRRNLQLLPQEETRHPTHKNERAESADSPPTPQNELSVTNFLD